MGNKNIITPTLLDPNIIPTWSIADHAIYLHPEYNIIEGGTLCDS
jgi:hypothetical protein